MRQPTLFSNCCSCFTVTEVHIAPQSVTNEASHVYLQYKGHLESTFSVHYFCSFKVNGLDLHQNVMGSSFACAQPLHQS